MANITSILLVVSCVESAEMVDLIHKEFPKYNSNRHEKLVEVHNDVFVGPRAPDFVLLGGGFKYLYDVEKFAKFVVGLAWDYPEDVVVMVIPDAGGVKIYRPDHY